MLIASRREGDRLRTLKWALTGTEVLVISANGRNKPLILFLQDCCDPIFLTMDKLEAGYFTAKLFPNVEVLIDENPFPEKSEEESHVSAPCFLANLVGKVKENVVEIQEDQEDKNGVDDIVKKAGAIEVVEGEIFVDESK